MIKNLYIESIGRLSVEEAVRLQNEAENGDPREDYWNALYEDVYAEGFAYLITLTYDVENNEPITYSVDCSDIVGFDERFRFEDEITEDRLYVKWNILYVDEDQFELPESMLEKLSKVQGLDYKRPDTIRLTSICHHYLLEWVEIEELIICT